MGSRSTSEISERWSPVCSFEMRPGRPRPLSLHYGDTMLFAIHALDFTGALPTRLANYDAYKAFLSDTALWRQDCDMRPAVAAFSWSNRAAETRSKRCSRYLGTRFDYGICTTPRLKSPRSCRSYCNC